MFLLDVRDEYPEFTEVDLGKFFSLKWERENQRIRFVPNPNKEASQGEASAIFSHLIFVMGTGALKSWVIVTEEAHRFGQDLNLRTLLIEARKFTRKLLIVTTDWRQYADIAQVFKPKPWEVETPQAFESTKKNLTISQVAAENFSATLRLSFKPEPPP